MNRDKHIEEMDTDLRKFLETSYVYKIEYAHYGGFDYHKAVFTEDIAKALYNAGYRKSTDVAREIFVEIEKEIELALDSNYRAKKEHYGLPNYDNFKAKCDGEIFAMRGLLDFIAELKKKYTEEGK